MANIRKTFNFRNGVQVDEDNLIVNSLGLVGIGTTVPTEALDVRGTAKIVGLATATQVNAPYAILGVATITSTNIGIATVSTKLTAANLSITSGIVTVTSGVVTFYGDGSGLYNIPTSQWVDIDVGLGFTSIYAAGYVGVATVDPRFAFQVGGNNNVGNFQSGVGINSTGDILATGIISATTLRGNGPLITGLNASNISSGTLDSARLPANINIAGIATFNGNVFVSSGSSVTAPEYYGIAREVSTVKSAYFGNTVEIENLGFGTGLLLTGGANLTITSGNATIGGSSSITGSLSVGGASTISGSLNVGGASSITGSLNVGGAATIAGSLTVGGLSAIAGSLSVGSLTASSSNLGLTTTTSLQANNVRVGIAGSSEIDTISGNLTLNSAAGTTIINDNLSVSGISTLSGEVVINTGLVPNISSGSYIGTSGKPFGSTYIRSIAIGDIFPNKIESLSGSLLLGAVNNQVNVDTDLYVVGIATLNNTLNVTNQVLPVSDLSANLGSTTKRFNQAYISAIQVGVALSNQINSSNNTDLILNSATGVTVVDDDLRVTGLGTFSGLLVANQNIIPGTNNTVSLGTSSLRFNEAHIDGIRIGVAQTNVIDTLNLDLILDSSTGITRINDNVYVTGIGSFSSEISSNIGFVPGNNLGAYIGTSGKRFDKIYANSIDLNDINIGINSSSTITSSIQPLFLQSLSAKTIALQGYLYVVDLPSPIPGDNAGVVRVGLGTTSPSGSFQVGSQREFSPTVVSSASTIGITTTIITGINTSNITVGLQILESDGLISSGTTVISVGVNQIGIGTTTLNDAEEVFDFSLTFGTGYVNNRVFTVTDSKSVGIGTTNPTAKLDVRGDVRVGTSNSEGVILTSPNGTKYRLIVSNAGALSTVLVP